MKLSVPSISVSGFKAWKLIWNSSNYFDPEVNLYIKKCLDHHEDGIWSMALSRTLKCMKTERWPLRGAFLPQGRQLWGQPWPAWQDEVIDRKANRQNVIVTCWTRLAPLVGSVLFATPGFALDPTPGEDLQKVSPRLFLTWFRFWGSLKIINPISPISCWLSLLVIVDFPSYWCIISAVGYHCCCISLLFVIINAVGYHRCFLLLTYPVVIPHICHGSHGYIRVNFFWPV